MSRADGSTGGTGDRLEAVGSHSILSARQVRALAAHVCACEPVSGRRVRRHGRDFDGVCGVPVSVCAVGTANRQATG